MACPEVPALAYCAVALSVRDVPAQPGIVEYDAIVTTKSLRACGVDAATVRWAGYGMSPERALQDMERCATIIERAPGVLLRPYRVRYMLGDADANDVEYRRRMMRWRTDDD